MAPDDGGTGNAVDLPPALETQALSAVSIPEGNNICDGIEAPQDVDGTMSPTPDAHENSSDKHLEISSETSEDMDTQNPDSSDSILVESRSPKNKACKSDPPSRRSSANTSRVSAPGRAWVCKNAACKAVLSSEDIYCKRCSCCICHLFDDNKDPSLWLVCSSETGDRGCCGSSCHIECALKHQKAGCSIIGAHIQLDGNYCCASCGKIIGILGCWKRQLAVAKDARRLDVFCYRILLSCRLLHGTLRYKELFEIAETARVMLETEVGPLNGVSSSMGRSIVGRLPVARKVQELCSQAILKADELIGLSGSELVSTDSLPPACKFKFEEITSSSLVIVLKEASSLESFEGYKLWHWKSREQLLTNIEPAVFPKEQRKVVVSNLQPCTEYAFRIISYSGNKEVGHSEAKCFTKSVEIIRKSSPKNSESVEIARKSSLKNSAGKRPSTDKHEGKNVACRPSNSKVRKLGKVVRQLLVQEEACGNIPCKGEIEDSCDRSRSVVPRNCAELKQEAPSLSCELDLNVASVPDLNVDAVILAECSREANGCSSEKNGHMTSNGSGDSQTCDAMQVADVPAMESQSEGRERHSQRQQRETCEDGSTLLIGSPSHFARKMGDLDDNYEHCVKVVRWLEQNDHIDKAFRMKFLTWFSLRSTEQERRIVATFIRTLIEDPSCLAEQLMDSFEEIVSCKKPLSGFCSKLWH